LKMLRRKLDTKTKTVKTLREQLEASQTKVNDMNKELTKATQSLKLLQNKIAASQKETKKLNKRASDGDRAVEAAKGFKDAQKEMMKELKQMKSSLGKSEKEVTRQDKLIALHDSSNLTREQHREQQIDLLNEKLEATTQENLKLLRSQPDQNHNPGLQKEINALKSEVMNMTFIVLLFVLYAFFFCTLAI
jgi:chromosome segregation ATPase